MSPYSFSHKSGATLRVITGNVFNVPANACIMGRNKSIKSQISSLVSTDFKALAIGSRTVHVLTNTSTLLPWKYVLSIDYRPAVCSAKKPFVQHTDSLSDDIEAVIKHSIEKLGCRSLAILPLSWRCPEKIAVATIAGIYKYIWPCAENDLIFGRVFNMLDVVLQQVRKEPNAPPNADLSSDMIHELAVSDAEVRSREISKRPRNELVFSIADIQDATPFVEAARNSSNCLTSANAMGRSYIPSDVWNDAPFFSAE